MFRRFILLPFLLFLAIPSAVGAPRKTKNVLFITTDGLRWQEMFRGAEEALLTFENGGIPKATLMKVRRTFWRRTAEERRTVLMPFLWAEIAVRGQVFGNRDAGSEGQVTNGFNISYPGYSEFLCGRADDERIKTNEGIPNPNINVLEFLHGRTGFAGRVASYNTWGILRHILNQERSGLPMWTHGDRTPDGEAGPVQAFVEEALARHPWPWREESLDIFTHMAAREYFVRKTPRVFYVNYGETDEWAHAGRYDQYLASIVNTDGFVREWWELVQSMPEYRGTTTLIFTTDHGRGSGLSSWRTHGKELPESREWWFAILGPDTPPLGARAQCPPVTQSQVAATIASALGEDFRAAVPEAAPALDVFE